MYFMHVQNNYQSLPVTDQILFTFIEQLIKDERSAERVIWEYISSGRLFVS